MIRYPLGIQTFEEIIENNYPYVDKTKVISQLFYSKIFFLARPRRFGKSLLISTLKSIFEGRKELFKGLYIENKITWESFPVILISLNTVAAKDTDLQAVIFEKINEYAGIYNISLENNSTGGRFMELIKKISVNGKVVLLIDEYDKPLISFIDDTEIFEKNRNILKEFYGSIKDLDAHLKFVFITGVSRFSKVSLFSDLNNLTDISMRQEYCDICGYTEADMHHYFTEPIAEIAQEMGISTEDLFEKVKKKYNGYNFYGKEKMYNPWSVLNFLASHKLDNYWFETGTPTFLTKIAHNLQTSVEGVVADKSELAMLNFQSDNLTPLLYQTGYLTIDEEIEDGLFRLRFPNEEVSESFTRYLLGEYTNQSTGNARYTAIKVRNAMKDKNKEALVAAINPIFANITYQIFLKDKEAYYHAVIHLIFMLLNYNVKSEVATNAGRIDTVLLEQHEVWLFEFKLNSTAEIAFQQIVEKDYAKPYKNTGKTIFGVGINFDSETKKINEIKFQML